MPRRSVTIFGTVQGVGFRPHVFRLARGLGLDGFVRNRDGKVQIEAEGDGAALDCLVNCLTRDPPPLARIERVESKPLPPQSEVGFRIEPSDTDDGREIHVAPDVATCAACRSEMFDDADRRFRYPFLNCTQCGPRYTILAAAPYDRERTTMAGFTMCPECRREYDDPADRRFHAQPTACAACGPRLEFVDGEGRTATGADPLERALASLHRGAIGAIKGLGGYHLVCDATSGPAVAELRRRKGRDSKPLAVMVADLQSARALCEVSAEEAEWLGSWRAPIVLLRRCPAAAVADEVAPENPCLGVMLPNTPLHHLLLRGMRGRPLVVTSGNAADGPIAYRDADALEQLKGVADFFLVHDRPIRVGCDDSVVRIVSGSPVPIRRSRGWVPEPVALPQACPVPTLALGGQLKATFALGRGREAIVSQHLGDLESFDNYRTYTAAIRHFEELFAFQPALLVHDLHPDYASTRFAMERLKSGRPGEAARTLAVQHHHAHMAGCMAENQIDGPAIGVVFDGTGFGLDGAIWGGEFLAGDSRQFHRVAHFRYVSLPGGDQAIREPWRMAAAHLLDAGEDPSLLADRVTGRSLALVKRMIERKINAPPTSSVGRLFDAVSVIASGAVRVSHEAQAAMELEAAADRIETDEVYPFDVIGGSPDCGVPLTPAIIDTRPLIAAIAGDLRNGYTRGRIARKFHATVAEIISAVCRRLRESTGINTIVLSGGVFANALLLDAAIRRLTGGSFDVHWHRLLPSNDGGLSFGQLAVAAAQRGVADVSGHTGPGR